MRSLIVLCVLLLGCDERQQRPRRYADPEVQSLRLSIIKDLQKAKFIEKLETGGQAPTVWVRYRFMMQDHQDKARACEIIWAYAHKIPKDAAMEDMDGLSPLLVMSVTSGKGVAHFDATSGFWQH